MVNMRNFQFKRIIMLFAVVLFFVGCVPEQKIGTQYLTQRQKMTLVLRAPEWVKMVNLSEDSIKDGAEFSQREKDSIKFYKSTILQKVKDSTIISNYIKGLKEGLEKQGYKTMIANSNDTVFPVSGNAFLINIGQIELDEQKYPIRDETQYNGKLYAADYDILRIELSFWLEVSKIENGLAIQPLRLLYDSFEKTEEISGKFVWNMFDKKMDYVTDEERFTPQYVELVPGTIGSDHAVRLNNYLLNEYIGLYFPDKPNRPLYGVNPQFGTLTRIYTKPFKEIQE